MSFFFPTPTPTFPSVHPGYPTKIKPTFASLVQTSVSGVEVKSARQAYPLYEFEVPFEVLRDQLQNPTPDPYFTGFTELEQISGLFLACRGQYGRFYYSCPEDNSRVGQLIALGDNSTVTFRIVRTWGAGTLSFTDPVGALDTGSPFTIYLSGTPDTGNWTVSADKTLITRNSAPGLFQPITMDFHFFYLCRFIEDLEDFEQFYRRLWLLKSCKFRSVKQ
jgi:hypothetical protein